MKIPVNEKEEIDPFDVVDDFKPTGEPWEGNTLCHTPIDKPERGLSSRQMLCERLLCPNGELNALGPHTQEDPHW